MGSGNYILSEQDKRNFCAIMLERYGLHLDINNELLPVFFVAYQSARMSEDMCIKTREHIEQVVADFDRKAVSKIGKLEMKQYHFNNTKDAFWFAFGKYGISMIIISCLLFSGWLFKYINSRKEKDTDQITFLLERSPVEERKLNDTTLMRYITLFPVKDLKSALAGKNYVFYQKCNCIEIPLYYQKTASTK